MKKSLWLTICMLGISGYAGAAVTINYDTMLDSDGVLTTVYTPTTVYDFSADPGLTGDYILATGSLGGKYAAPYNNALMSGPDATPYLSVPENLSNGQWAELSFGTTYNYFGLFWGSADGYNTLSFYNGGSEVASFTGSQAIDPSVANGNQSAPSTNTYVNFLDLPDYDTVRFTSTNYAFEVDNVAVGNDPTPVPVPGSFLLASVGLAGMRHIRRKKA